MGDQEVSRRTLLQQGALLTGLGVIGGGDASGVTNRHNWPSQRPDRRDRLGLVPDEPMQESDGSNPRTNLGVIWELSFNAACRPLYVNDTLLVGTSNGLVALNPENGNQVFQLNLGNTRGSSPVYHNGSVYVETDNGQTATIYAIDLSTQTIRWESSTEFIESANTGIPYRMTTAEDTLFASANGAGVYAFSADSGSVNWQFKPSTGNFPYINTTPAISEERVFVSSFETGEIYAIERQSGTLDWNRNVSAETFHPIITDGTVYVSGQDQVWALDATSGSVEWTRDIQYAAEFDGMAAYDSDNIYLTGRSDEQYVYALNLESGTTRWKTEASGGKVRLAGNVLYVINGRSPIVSINPETGERLGSINQGTHASIDGGKIYAVDMWEEKILAIGEGAPANFSVSPSTPTTDERVRLVAETHESITRYEWAIDSNQFTEKGPEITKTFTQASTPRVRLRVTTSDGATNTAEKTITVQKASSDQYNFPELATALLAVAGTTLAGIGALRYRRADDETTTPFTTDAGVTEWRQPGRDITRTAAVPTAQGPRTHPETAGEYRPDEGKVAMPPAITDDLAVLGTTEDELHALSLETGGTGWSVETDAEDLTAPAATEHIIYVGSDDGVHAHGLKEGDERWTAPLGTVTTLLAGDAIYVGTDEAIHALRPTGGSQQWQTDCDGRVDALAVRDGTLYAASEQSVTALDADTGDQHWQIDAPGRNLSLSVGDVLVVSTRSQLTAHDPGTGEQLWADDEGGQPTAVALAHGRVYQTTDTAVRALNDQAGTESWRTAIDATTGPIVVGDTVYIGTEGDLVALDAEDGDYAFTHDLPGVQGALAVVGNAISCQTGDGALTTVTAELSNRPELHATTAERGADETETDDDAQTDEDDVEPTDTPTPTTAAGRFARDCDVIADATLVSDSGSVHVYDGTVTDRQGETDARIYALAPAHAGNETAVETFETIAREWQSISKNKHIATVYHIGSKPRPWVAFDAGHGRLDEGVAALDRTERIDVIVGLAESMRTGSMYNIVHGGLTPETVFLAEDLAGDQIATVADWGLERAVREAVAESVVTPYTAPEQLDGENAGDDTDIYHLGAVAYRVLTGEIPFTGAADLTTAIEDGDVTPPTEHDPTLPEKVDDILADAMASGPDDRLASPYDFQQRLLGAMDD